MAGAAKDRACETPSVAAGPPDSIRPSHDLPLAGASPGEAGEPGETRAVRWRGAYVATLTAGCDAARGAAKCARRAMENRLECATGSPGKGPNQPDARIMPRRAMRSRVVRRQKKNPRHLPVCAGSQRHDIKAGRPDVRRRAPTNTGSECLTTTGSTDQPGMAEKLTPCCVFRRRVRPTDP